MEIDGGGVRADINWLSGVDSAWHLLSITDWWSLNGSLLHKDVRWRAPPLTRPFFVGHTTKLRIIEREDRLWELSNWIVIQKFQKSHQAPIKNSSAPSPSNAFFAPPTHLIAKDRAGEHIFDNPQRILKESSEIIDLFSNLSGMEQNNKQNKTKKEVTAVPLLCQWSNCLIRSNWLQIDPRRRLEHFRIEHNQPIGNDGSTRATGPAESFQRDRFN